MAGPISERVVRPDALGMSVRTKSSYMDKGTGSRPRPKPATYETGAGMDKNARLFLFDAIAIRFAA